MVAREMSNKWGEIDGDVSWWRVLLFISLHAPFGSFPFIFSVFKLPTMNS